jgi:hypothetical protein
MEKTEPISPEQAIAVNYSMNPIIDYINEQLLLRNWHTQHIKRSDYLAIIFPYGRFSDSMKDRAVKLFVKVGWDCYWDDAYDGRGPHECFYVHRRHFAEHIDDVEQYYKDK